MADVLFGDYNPAGRLPFTVYKSIGDLPPFDDYDITKGRTYMYFQGEPLYPFGHGLSYTTFDYYDLDVQQKGQGADAVIEVSFGVINAGDRDGDEVAQVYARRINAPADRPLKKLHGFKRVSVEKERDTFVAIAFPVSDLAAWDAQAKQFAVVPGEYEIMVGGSSADIALRKTITIKQPGAVSDPQ
jgi:beta-glucosidase